MIQPGILGCPQPVQNQGNCGRSRFVRLVECYRAAGEVSQEPWHFTPALVRDAGRHKPGERSDGTEQQLRRSRHILAICFTATLAKRVHCHPGEGETE